MGVSAVIAATQGSQRRRWPGPLRIVLILLTLLDGLGMPGAGWGKFSKPVWHDAFVVWGYPMWFMYAVGVAEIVGGLSLFVPGLASWAALGLMTIMLGAVATSLHHPILAPQPFTWSAPTFHLCILGAIAAMRWKERWRPKPHTRM